jgi:Lar family restriction alleviation protein
MSGYCKLPTCKYIKEACKQGAWCPEEITYNTAPSAGHVGESDLLFCPFCKSTEVSLSYSIQNNEEKTKHYFIECEKCAACGPDYMTERFAVHGWNTRAK